MPKENSKQILESIVKSSLSLLTPFGTLLNEVLFDYGSRIKNKRLTEFVEDLNKKINDLDNEKIDLQSLTENEDFYDLIVKVLNSVAQTKSNEKRALFSNLVIKNIVSQNTIDDDIDYSLINCINELTPSHFSVFLFIEDNIDFLKRVKSFDDLYRIYIESTSAHIDKGFFRLIIKDLENNYLVRVSKNVYEYGSSGGAFEQEDSKLVPSISITTFGESFFNLF